MDEYYFENEEPTFMETWEVCVVPSILDVYRKILYLLVYNILFNITTQIVKLPDFVFHSSSFLWGFVLLNFTLIGNIIWPFLFYVSIYYAFMYLMFNMQQGKWINIEYTTGITCISCLLLCELFYPYQEDWLQARGVFMIVTMKLISLASDVRNGLKFPKFLQFLGYTFCPGNCIFGPWTPFSDYISICEKPHKKNWKWIFQIILITAQAFVFLTVSNCWTSYLIPDSSYKWLIAYRQAQSFRASHYFISYLSEAGMISAGYKDETSKNDWRYEITKPLGVEFPSSLMRVVISWNIPMHQFLKKHVYKVCSPHGQFKAILATYLVSSFLHGFNTEIAVVLLTIGLFSYVQLKFQDKLSVEFNACLKVRPCKSCTHKYKNNHIFVLLMHATFSFLTIIHLAYLGILMDSVGVPESPSIYNKWDNLNFLSHWLIFICYIYIHL